MVKLGIVVSWSFHEKISLWLTRKRVKSLYQGKVVGSVSVVHFGRATFLNLGRVYSSSGDL